jgi:GNAT superfamily N-acetyltransferase
MDTQPSSLELTIRTARADDVETLLEIQREASLAAFGHVFPPERYPYPSDAIRERWREALASPAAEVAVAEVEGAPTGVAFAEDDFLNGLYVLPDRQRTGVGTALHDWALERLRVRGCSRAKLWTLERNAGARRFYERRGWVLTGETRVVPFPPHPLDVGYSLPLGS